MILLCCASELGLPEDLSAIEVILYYYYYYYNNVRRKFNRRRRILRFKMFRHKNRAKVNVWNIIDFKLKV